MTLSSQEKIDDDRDSESVYIRRFLDQ